MGESQRDKREDFFAAVLFAGMNHNSGGKSKDGRKQH